MPKISVVTPSFNQAEYLFHNLNSVASSPENVEHIVLDGGSTDGSVELLQAFDGHLAYWSSAKDGGMYDAINRGLQRATGEIMCWLNSDDMVFPWTFATVVQIFDAHPQIEWLTTRCPSCIDQSGAMIKMNNAYGFDHLSFLGGFNLPGAGWEADNYIQQESTFWRRSLWERAGGYVDSSFKSAGDFELWARFFEHAPLFSVDVPLGTFRRHGEQKTSVAFEAYLDEARACLLRYAGALPNPALMPDRLAARRDPARKEALIDSRLADWAPVVTYDWGRQIWVTDRN